MSISLHDVHTQYTCHERYHTTVTQGGDYNDDDDDDDVEIVAVAPTFDG